MKRYKATIQWAAATLIFMGIVACAGGHSAPTQFFMIDPVTPASGARTPLAEGPAVLISLDPVEIPEYLNRPQIVTHLDGTEYHLDEFNNWLEPLDETLTRVIGENLSEMLADDRIDVLSMARHVETDFSVNVQIQRLDGTPGGEMVLIARWSLFDQTENALSLTKRSVFKAPMKGDSYQHLVAAQKRLIELLSVEIVKGIRRIVLQPGP